MSETPLRTETKKNYSKLAIIISLSFIVITGTILLFYFLPSFNHVKINSSEDTIIYFMGEEIEQPALRQDEQIYLPFNFVKEHLDSSIVWDEKLETTIITTDKEVYHFPLGKIDGLLNLKPYSFTYPIIKEGNDIYLPLDPIKDFYNIEGFYQEENNIYLIHSLDSPIQEGISVEKTKLRRQPTKRSAWIDEISKGKEVYIMREESGWYWVETADGKIGYIEKGNVKLTEIKLEKVEKKVYQPWNPIGKPVVLTWEYATNRTTNPDQINNLNGVQVVSPTWFHLQKDGLVSNSADIDYVKWAHKQGYQVWGLFANSFDPELTHEMLSNSELRVKVIKQLLSYVDLYQLDGINLDIENVYLKDKEALVQFVKELTPLLHEKDRTVSIDVTFKSKSENWSMFYDREKLGQIVDYVMIMAYDEHWASSPKAGSVSSLPWVENGLKEILKEVPNDKVLLGVPFYTRLWTEEKNSDGEIEVSSKTLTMKQAERWIKENNASIIYDDNSGQNYVVKKDGNITYKIWLEDSLSMGKRINIMKKYRLAGIATWRRGFESDDFWPVISNAIDER